ncbi:somatostatin-like receptor F_48D10.1 [Lytechinus variegatus]|uniref:somatostatin-like receptor F_48D10.1 n=1 Tax=Lytechinus variegatus TaxID=7654 RepID=UPI001BB29D43|nr:somatostatin-like receptor F_48D10.1 [Lytechinus variegatus]
MLALRYILGALIRAVIMAIGLPGNALIIIVYSKKQRKSGTDAFILGLAITDFVACLTFPLKIYSYVTTQFTNDFLCKTMYFTQYWTQFVGVFLTGIITIDRYIAVCKPLKKRLSPKQATIIVSLLCALAMVFAIPTLVWTGVQKFGVFASRCTYGMSNTRISPLAFTWVLHDINDALFYGTLVMIIFMYSRIWLTVYRRTRAKIGCVIPASITTVSGQVAKSEPTAETSTASKPDTTDNVNLSDCKTENTGTTANGVTTIVSGSNNGDSSGANGSGEGSSSEKIPLKPFPKPKAKSKPGKTHMQARASNKTTKMIFIITIIFFLSWVPAKLWVIMLRSKLMTNLRSNQVLYNIFYLSTFMVNINQAVNPFVYSFCNENFRKECVTAMRHFRQCRLS